MKKFVNPWEGSVTENPWDANHASTNDVVSTASLTALPKVDKNLLYAASEPETRIDGLQSVSWEITPTGNAKRLLYWFETDTNPVRGGEDYEWGEDGGYFPS